MEQIIDRIGPTRRPSGRVAMGQRWLDLTFMHWPIDPARIQATLPSGLFVDTFDGAAYVGLVPFTMRDVRPVWSPSVPGISHFHETNVRTYVVDGRGTPGVWFYSLDAANRIAVEIARALWRLPYHFARMTLECRDDALIYESKRLIHTPLPGDLLVSTKRPARSLQTATPGTLEFFLIERYILFAHSRGKLLSGQVHHMPYQFAPADAEIDANSLCAAAGFDDLISKPALVHFSPGVDVEVYSLRPTLPLAQHPAPNT